MSFRLTQARSHEKVPLYNLERQWPFFLVFCFWVCLGMRSVASELVYIGADATADWMKDKQTQGQKDS